jgi:predicted GNAT family acetyltransferase
MDEIRFTHNEPASRYELWVGDRLGSFLEYRRRDDRMILVHTETEPAMEGRGLGTRVVHDALEDIRAAGLTVKPYCPFVRTYIEAHPEYADLVA